MLLWGLLLHLHSARVQAVTTTMMMIMTTMIKRISLSNRLELVGRSCHLTTEDLNVNN